MISSQTHVAGLRRILAFFAVLLLGITWPLWSEPPSMASPRIPWFSWLCNLPAWVDPAGLVLVVCGLGAMGFGPGTARFTRWSLVPFVTGLLVLLAGDQHRLQPWTCQFLLCAVVLAIAPNRVGLCCWKWLIAGIYLYSALSKLDAAFLSAHGQLLLQGLLSPLGIETKFWSPQVRQAAALLFPLGEAAVALLLVLPVRRVWGLAGSWLMHLLLLWTLGLGLRHEWGVLTWNVYFLVQNLWLFGPECLRRTLPSPTASAPGDERNTSVNGLRGAGLSTRSALVFTALALAYPALEPFGRCDHWPAWAVYCSRPAQARVLIDTAGAAKLPPALVTYLGTPAPLDERLPFSLDSWSFATRRCPVYPQLRYRLALILALLENRIPDDSVTVELAFTPDRWTGARQRLTLSGLPDVRHYCQKFVLNTQAASDK